MAAAGQRAGGDRGRAQLASVDVRGAASVGAAPRRRLAAADHPVRGPDLPGSRPGHAPPLGVANQAVVAAIGHQLEHRPLVRVADLGVDAALGRALAIGELELTLADLATAMIEILEIPAKELFSGVIEQAELFAGTLQVVAGT